MSEKVLVVDDEREIADLVGLYLENEGYEVRRFYSAMEALACAQQEAPDLAMLDVMMPDMNGFSLCQRLREDHTCPIIMLTARDDEIDKITGLALGADDYIVKPFRPLEMVARVKAQLRRATRYNSAPAPACEVHVLRHGGLWMDTATHQCLLDGEALALTPTEFSILRILLQRQGQVVSAEGLFHEIWQDEYYSKSNNTITVHIRHLREKLNDTVERPRYIKTIWGVGYRLGA